jgi:transposase
MSLLAAVLLTGLSTVSCSSDKAEVEKKLEHRNKEYSSYQDRRAMRTQARQERTDRWFDRTMGKPPRTETGLKLPD